jgi:hypothetical protein
MRKPFSDRDTTERNYSMVKAKELEHREKDLVFAGIQDEANSEV